MKGIIKRLVAVILTIALVVTGINFTPNKVNAADFVSCTQSSGNEWYNTNGDGSWSYFLASWAEATGAYSGGDALDNFALRVDTNNGTQWGIQVKTPSQTITSGKTYNVSMTLNSSAAGAEVLFKEEGTGNGFSDITQTLVAGDNTYTGTFTATSNTIQFLLHFGYLSAGTTVEVKSFTITESSSGDTLPSGFTACVTNSKTMLGEWGYYVASGLVGYSGGTALNDFALSVVTNTVGEWGIQAIAKDMSVDAGSSYTVSVTLNSDKAGASVLFKDDLYGDLVTKTLTVGDNVFEATYTPTSTDNLARYIFNLYALAAGTTVKITSFSLTKNSSGGETSDWTVITNSGDQYYYKNANNMTVDSVQQPAWASESGVYMYTTAAPSYITINGVKSSAVAIDGAGAVIYLSALTADVSTVAFCSADGTVIGSVDIKNVNGTDTSETTAFSLEAEAATLANGAKAVASTSCSNGYYVNGIGSSSTKGTATFTVYAKTAGERELKIYHNCGGTTRTFYVTTNDGDAVSVDCGDTGGWTIPTTSPNTIKVNLKVGKNTITFANDSNYAPDLDRIEVALTDAEAAETVEAMIDGLPKSITADDKALVTGINMSYEALANKEAVSNYDDLRNALDIVNGTVSFLSQLEDAYIYDFTEAYDGAVCVAIATDANADKVSAIRGDEDTYRYNVNIKGTNYENTFVLEPGTYYSFSSLGLTDGEEYSVTMQAVFTPSGGTAVTSEPSETTYFTYRAQKLTSYDNGIAQVHINTSSSQKLKDNNYNVFTDTTKSKINASIVVKNTNGSNWCYDYGTVNVRGNSTSLAQKKAYNIKFHSKQNPLGLSGTYVVDNGDGTATAYYNEGVKKWSLLANAFDKTLLRNQVAMEFQSLLEKSQGNFADGTSKEFTSKSTPVDLYVDGKYVGSYTLIESVEVDETRVNIDTSYVVDGTDDIEDGYAADTVTIDGVTYKTYDTLLELANDTKTNEHRFEDDTYYFDTGLERFVLNEPERTNTAYDYAPTSDNKPEFVKTTQEFVQAFETALQNNDYEAFSQFIDVQSFADFYITAEYFMIKDINFSSTRFYIRDGKLYAGPLWDLDLSSGNIIDHESYEGFRSRDEFEWFKLLMANKTFADVVRERYKSLHDSGFISDFYEDGGYADEMANTVAASAKTNYENSYNGYDPTGTGYWGYTMLYGIQGNNWDQAVSPVDQAGALANGLYGSTSVYDNYEAYVTEYRTWLENRDAWLYNALNELQVSDDWIAMPDMSGENTVEYYYKPSATDTLSIFPGTGELSSTILFVLGEGLSSVTVDGKEVSFEGAGVHISKEDIEPDTTYLLVATSASGKTATIRFKYERTIDETNIAYNKNIISSGTAADGYDTSDLVDEFNYSKWEAATTDDSWFVVDLGAQYEIEEIEILFGRAYADAFEIQLSRDNETWINSRTVTNFNGSQDIGAGNQITWSSTSTLAMGNPNYGCMGKARYVKFKASSSVPADSGVAVYEFRVRGEKLSGDLSNVALREDVTVTSNKEDAEGSYAVDGDYTTKWTSVDSEGNPYIEIDLDGEHELYSVDLMFKKAYPSSFRIQISDDGEMWEDAKTVNNWTEPGSADEVKNNAAFYNARTFGYSLHMDQVKASYVRLYVDAKNNESWGISLSEFEVWGKDVSRADYWNNISQKDFGIYAIDGLYDTKTDADATSMKYSALVQSDIIVNGDTYEVEYEAGKSIYFFVNPYNFYIEFDEGDTVNWSSADNAYGANYNADIVQYGEKNTATVKYVLPDNVDFGGADYVTTQIACQIYDASNSAVERTITFTLKVLRDRGIDITDTISSDGCLNVENPESGATYVWQRSSDGKNWETVSEKRYDLEVITNNGASVNVAKDFGGGMYYRVRKSGTSEWSLEYKVPYYNDVQNGDFEYPAMHSLDAEDKNHPFNTNGDEQQYPNGYPGLVWKTTAPGWRNGQNGINVGQDIEIVNGRWLKKNGPSWGGFSVTLDEMYGDGTHGDQFAELNCENAGALYQDILTTPGTECYWELDHAGRWQQNTMYVVAMSTQDAQNYTTEEQINTIVEKAKALNLNDTDATSYDGSTKIVLDDKGTTDTSDEVAYVWKAVTDEAAGVWVHHTGKYVVPEGNENYLTRFFFASDSTSCWNNDATIGNFLDNVTFEQKQSYTIEYYIEGENDGNPVYTVDGISLPYDRIAIPDEIPSYDLTQYTYTGSQIGGSSESSTFSSYYIDDTGMFTIAYEHNVLKIYYESGAISLTKRIDGMSSIPAEYIFTFEIKDAETGELHHTIEVTGDQFSTVDKVDPSDPDSCFVTVSFKGNGLTELGGKDLVENAEYIVTEKVSDPTVEEDDGFDKYLSTVNANGKTIDVAIADLVANVAFSSEAFTYTGVNDRITYVNTYETVKKLTVTKNVTGNMGDRAKDFDFTLTLTKAGVAVDASTVSADASKTETGTYTFNLKHKESVEFMVYAGTEAKVAEKDYSDEYYTTTWEVKEEQEAMSLEETAENDAAVHTTSVNTGAIQSNLIVTCTNDNNDIGDVEVQGFQMNTDPAEGGVSEFNPSFRVVYRVAKDTIKRNKVKKYGVIYGAADQFSESDNVEDIMILNDEGLENIKASLKADTGSDVTVNAETVGEAYKGIIYSHQTNREQGIYPYWSTNDEFTEDVWDYYALTIKGMNYIYEALEANLAFRAYAVVENADGTYSVEYGKNIYTISMYEIAEDLYQNQRISSKSGHEFLYNNVLNVVDTMNNRKDMCYAMLTTLSDSDGKVTQEAYNLCNGAYKDMQDYAYCEGNYVDTYPRTTKYFPLYRITEQTLLDKLNAVTNTSDTKLFDWLYAQTELAAGGKYKGFYKEVRYSWDNEVFQDFDKE